MFALFLKGMEASYFVKCVKVAEAYERCVEGVRKVQRYKDKMFDKFS